MALEDMPVRVTEVKEEAGLCPGLWAYRSVQDVHTILGKELVVKDITKN